MITTPVARPTVQEAYDRMVEYFSRPGAVLAQRDRMMGVPQCYYRHPDNGAACAVGCLLPDDVARECDFLEDTSIDHVVAHHRAIHEWSDDPDLVFFLSYAQNSHDLSKTVEEFLSKLRSLARRHNLKVS